MRELFAKRFIISVQSASGMQVKKNDNSRVLNREGLITNDKPAKPLAHGDVESPQLELDLGHVVKERRLVYRPKIASRK